MTERSEPIPLPTTRKKLAALAQVSERKIRMEGEGRRGNGALG